MHLQLTPRLQPADSISGDICEKRASEANIGLRGVLLTDHHLAANGWLCTAKTGGLVMVGVGALIISLSVPEALLASFLLIVRPAIISRLLPPGECWQLFSAAMPRARWPHNKELS